MKETYKAGELVVLKSGGPVMTVTSENYGTIQCQWFAGKKLESGHFPAVSLERPKEESK
jgi:uncharacterized protein YodC (DUF2158 family)